MRRRLLMIKLASCIDLLCDDCTGTVIINFDSHQTQQVNINQNG